LQQGSAQTNRQRNHNAQHNALTEHQQAEHQRNAAYQFNG
jgi:hypothetical protein